MLGLSKAALIEVESNEKSRVYGVGGRKMLSRVARKHVSVE